MAGSHELRRHPSQNSIERAGASDPKHATSALGASGLLMGPAA
ncbi:MAG TPA: hypothetical protein VFQ05_13050 [Candidatus Eisenbacteria bacterium]|nr:hypothetical protein [Candidatus Eisenbacteria bacterium]